jgi:hypothetical protein
MIYVDMDGVLVAPDSEDFAARSWAPGGAVLWAHLAPLSPTLLSWGRTGAEFVRIMREKQQWVAKHLGVAPLIVLPDTPKAAVCKPGDILIDDADKHREPWQAAGGVFVHHTDLQVTLAVIRKLKGL